MDITQFQPVDRVSNVADNVADSILMHLTLHDAAKTSILSKQWRYKWVKLPQLRFDETLWQEYEGNLESARMKFLLILYKVLLLRKGPITKLSFVIPKLKIAQTLTT
ncbi:F-box FBD LRR-repeat At1g13570-like [Olea europaea subsp. europaea]|uniref:F-box FBD LRR-repeat At1g13570-like n=1 Tax=Olea europaea subsp. europaea TaxID=158383 RepID=A0A8S0P6I8_OLEEU|nr:F-box FBD LRR-repeat At1g13570-like [Olea europaea subsp. europaea]